MCYCTSSLFTPAAKRVTIAMGSRIVMLLAAALALLAAARVAESAVSCSQVYGQLNPCVSFMFYGTPLRDCCSGINSVLRAAPSPDDRQAVCNCLKNAAQNVPMPAIAAAASIPQRCKISLPYEISPNVDCSR